MAHRNFPILTALFPETQHAPFAEVPIVGEAQLRDGPDASAGVGQNAEYGAIAEADDVAGVDRLKKFTGLLDRQLGRPAFRHAVLDAGDGGEGIEGDGVTLHQRVEKPSQRRESLIFRRRGAFELAEIIPGQAGGDGVQFEFAIAAPGEEAADDPAIGAARVFVADAGAEEFVGGEGGIWRSFEECDRSGRHGKHGRRRWYHREGFCAHSAAHSVKG